MLLIIVTEGDSKAATDWKYVKSFLDAHYDIRNKAKLKPIFLSSKSKFMTAQNKLKPEIDAFFRMRVKGNDRVEVVMCFDTDFGGDGQEQNSRIEQYSKERGYHLVWMHRDVEEVFLGQRVDDKAKVQQSNRFLKTNGIARVDVKKLNAHQFAGPPFGTSNIKTVFDEILLPLRRAG